MHMNHIIKQKSIRQRLWKTLNVFVGVSTVLNISMVGVLIRPLAAQAANPSADIDQCANDPAPSLHTDGCNTAATQWDNGNLGASKSVYFENDTIPYRLKFSNLSLVSHTVTIEWDTTKGGKHAIDYVKTWNATVADANPCLGVAGCTAPGNTFAIPADPQVTGAGVTPVAGNFTLFGGTITAVSPYSYSKGAGFTGDKSASVDITFTANVANPVLAWGGHIADRHDWGASNSAISIPGSPYHSRLLDLDGSGGNQDRSLSADEVIFPASITIIKQANPEGSLSFGYTSTGGLSPASFSLVDDGTVANTKVFSGLTNFTTYTVSETAVPGWTLSFNNPVCTVTTANGGSQSANASTLTVNLKEGENVSCTFNNERQAATVNVIKHVINDNGGTKAAGDFAISASGAGASPASFNGDEAGTLITVNPGVAYSVAEGAHTGYAVSYSADCNSSVAAGQSKACTITNNDIQPKLTVTKVVINDNGGKKVVSDFPLFVGTTGVTSGAQNGLNAGAYTISETQLARYSGTITGDCASNGSITLNPGDVKSCTITNDDRPSTLIVKKVLVNDNGGNAVVTDFSFKVNNGNSIAFENDAQNDLAVDAGTYSVVENTASGYATTYSNCTNLVIPNGGTATCTITNDDVAPQLTVIKHVINDNGGTKVASDFSMNVTATNVSTSTFPGNELGTTVTLNQGTFSVDELSHLGYVRTFSGDCSGTIALGQVKTCTITNNDIQPKLTVTKVVINDEGGTKVANDFALFVGLTSVTSAQQNGFSAGTYVVSEASTPGYVGTISGDCNAQGQITLGVGDVKSCTITNNDIAPNLSITKVNNVASFANPGNTVTYTVVVTNAATANDTARNVVLHDVLPSGFTYVLGGGSSKDFALGDIAPGASVTTTYDAVISAAQAAGTYTNTATAKGSNTLTVSATSNVGVRVGEVLGITTVPALTITKDVNVKETTVGSVVKYTVTVTNTGDVDLTNVVLTDTLPAGFIFVEGGARTKTWTIGRLAANHQRIVNFDVQVTKSVKAGVYTNVATVRSNELPPQSAKRPLTVKQPRVLGLATTGVSSKDYLTFATGLGLIMFGLFWSIQLRRRYNGDNA